MYEVRIRLSTPYSVQGPAYKVENYWFSHGMLFLRMLDENRTRVFNPDKIDYLDIVEVKQTAEEDPCLGCKAGTQCFHLPECKTYFEWKTKNQEVL